MIRKVLACGLLLGMIVPLSASADKDDQSDSLVRFEGGIGSQPLRAAGAPNLVLGVSPGGAPWVIDRLSVDVKLDGRISAAGRGLLVAGGNGVATNAGQSVRARLSCGGVFHDSGLPVALAANGDFRIEDVLTPVPPAPCTSPVLLIVNANGSWFAAGIRKL